MGIRDNLIRAMQRGGVTLMVCADYAKTFATVTFKSILIKLHSLGFSKSFLVWMLNYLSDRWQFVQVDANETECCSIQFEVPQGTILGSFTFNLYVADLQENLQCTCNQYADDTAF